MRLLALFLFAFSAFGAVSASPGGCVSSGGVISVHPCTATVTFAGSTATSGEIAEIQAVFDSANRGDTLITPSNSDINACSLQIAGTNWGGPADEYFVWKSADYDTKFPPAGTRATRAHSSIATRVTCTHAQSSHRAFRIRGRLARGGVAPADHIEVKGIAFLGGYSGTAFVPSGLIELGENAVSAAVTNAATATSDNLTFTATEADLQVFLYSGTATITRDGVTVDPSEYTWVPWYGSVVFNSAQTPGVDIRISASSFTTTLPEHQPANIRFRHIIVDGEADLDDRQITRGIILNAKSSEIYDSHFQGWKNNSADSQSIAGWSASGPHVVSNNHLGGATENFMLGGATNTLGTNLVNGLTFTYNYLPHESYTFYNNWTANTWIRKGTILRQSASDSNQYLATNTGTTGSSTPTWDTTIGNNTVDGTVTWQRLSTARHYGFLKNNFELKQLVDGVIRWNYFPYMQAADQGCTINIKVESNANEGNTPFNQTKNILFANNVMESGFCAIDMSTNHAINNGPGDGTTAYGNFTVQDNLWRYYSASNMRGDKTNCAVLAFANFAGGQTLQNYFLNNLIDASDDPGNNCTLASEYNYALQNDSNWIFRNNIMTRTFNPSRPGFWGLNSGETEGSVAIRRRMQNVTSGAGSTATPIAAGRWTNNAIIGAPSGKYPNTDTGDTGNTNYIPAESAVGFRNTASGNFRLRNDSTYRNGSYNESKNLGPDWSQLPLMENFRVQVSDREATFEWDVTPAIKDIPCVITFGARDLLTFHGDMDPGTYTRPSSDENDINTRSGSGISRMIRVGSRVPLTASTEYGYRIECGGFAKESYITTAATLAGTGTLSITNPNATSMTWGTTYSRATDTISGGGSGSCSSGTCTATVTKGVGIYYRINGTGPVQLTYVQ